MKRFAYIFLVVFVTLSFSSCNQDDSRGEITKIALREIGHKLLLSNQDSTSLILPVTNIDKEKYKLSFQPELTIVPDSLVKFIKSSLNKANLPKNYRVEVIQCDDAEVAYSYEMQNEEEESIIACTLRTLPLNCYTIQIGFVKDKERLSIVFLLLFVILFIILGFLYRQKKKAINSISDNLFFTIGNYKFDKGQSKLLYIEKEIGLSKKECELLEILCDNLNDVVKRDELSKRVWEDHGVFVGRSLDTYISKLRKKLNEDTSIKITNVHGVGYKLEVSKD